MFDILKTKNCTHTYLFDKNIFSSTKCKFINLFDDDKDTLIAVKNYWLQTALEMMNVEFKN